MKRILSLCALVALVATPAFAQATYDRTPGQTLRYSLETDMTTSAISPQFEQNADVESDGIIAINFSEADTVRATFEKYNIVADMGGNKQELDLLTMMSGDFTFTMGDDGAVDVLATPTMTGQIQLPGGNVAQQFDNFFLPLPAEDLNEGTTWSTKKENTPQDGVTSTVEATYTVRGTDTKAGMNVLVIEVDATSKIDGETEQQGMSIVIGMNGTQTGEYYYSVEKGIMVGADITQKMKGGQDMEGNGQSMAIDIDMSGTNRTMLITE
ncbi:MAG: hypothetical protein RhofKO_39360 [Rhodothermales bacterium]